MAKFRHHRSTLQEAMETVCEVENLAALARILGTTPERIKVEPYGSGYDARIGWHTHIVSVGGDAVGFTDGPLGK